ncbi:MAG: hypothetical protein IJ857_03520 [Lachnospiraceae bacterium]|nr:hypothetical protein [Lachnospiraceae bacterium]
MIAAKLVVGIDFSDKYTLISTCHDPSEGVVTWSGKKDNEDFRVPVAAFKLPGSDRWVFGDEAVERAESFGMKYDTDILAKALSAGERGMDHRTSPEIVLLGRY